MSSEDAILDFAGGSFKSVWALELLLTLRRSPDRAWTRSEMIKELRSSYVAVLEALDNLVVAGLVAQETREVYRYRAGTVETERLLGELEKLYAIKPTLVIRKIATSPYAEPRVRSGALRIRR